MPRGVSSWPAISGPAVCRRCAATGATSRRGSISSPRIAPTLDQIRALSGPSIDRLAAFDLALARLAPLLKTVAVPADARGAHAAMLGAIGLAESASRGRARAIETQNLSVAWEASAAAAGAIQMAERAARDVAALLRPPAEP